MPIDTVYMSMDMPCHAMPRYVSRRRYWWRGKCRGGGERRGNVILSGDYGLLGGGGGGGSGAGTETRREVDA